MLFENGVYVDPLTVKLPTDEQISGASWKRFDTLRKDLVDRLASLGFVQSMNRLGGKMTDNATMESFFHSMKAEGIHKTKFANTQALSNHIRNYIQFYNSKRTHSSLGYVSPEEYEWSMA